jgi:hypothetical protein
MLALDRNKRTGPHLEWRVRLFVVAAVAGITGIHFEDRRLTGAAIVLLLAGVVLRFGKPRDESDPQDDPGA